MWINIDSTLMSRHGQFTCCLYHKNKKPDLTAVSRSLAMMNVKMWTQWANTVRLLLGVSLDIVQRAHL